MDLQAFQQIGTELGIGITAILAIVYLVLKMSTNYNKEAQELRDERKEVHSAFMAFVETNNHQRSELVERSTEAIIEAKNAIKNHNDLLIKHTEILHDMREDMRRNT